MSKPVKFFGTYSNDRMQNMLNLVNNIEEPSIDELMVASLVTVLLRERADIGKVVTQEEEETFERSDYEQALEADRVMPRPDFITNIEGTTSLAFHGEGQQYPICPGCGERHPPNPSKEEIMRQISEMFGGAEVVFLNEDEIDAIEREDEDFPDAK